MLANPQSTAQVDVDRRNRVRQRVVDFNTQLAQVCSANVHCRFDNNTVFNTVFVPSDVSTRDQPPASTGTAVCSTIGPPSTSPGSSSCTVQPLTLTPWIRARSTASMPPLNAGSSEG